MPVANLFCKDFYVVSDRAQRRFTDDQEVVAEGLEFVEEHKGMGSGECGVGNKEGSSSRSPLPTPYSRYISKCVNSLNWWKRAWISSGLSLRRRSQLNSSTL